MTGMAFIYGGVVVGRIERAVIPAIFAFLVNVAREVLKDVEDMEGDRKEHAVTLPIQYGIRPALMLATASLLLLIGITIAVGLIALYHPAFLFIVIIADCLICFSIVLFWLDHSPSAMRRASTLLKASMITGLLSIIVGSV
jgi:geranylgeranylglycerol-phosphate geranylgeranyltransferase